METPHTYVSNATGMQLFKHISCGCGVASNRAKEHALCYAMESPAERLGGDKGVSSRRRHRKHRSLLFRVYAPLVAMITPIREATYTVTQK